MRLMIDNLPIITSATLNSRFCEHFGELSVSPGLYSDWNLLWSSHGDVDIEGSWLCRVNSNDIDGN